MRVQKLHMINKTLNYLNEMEEIRNVKIPSNLEIKEEKLRDMTDELRGRSEEFQEFSFNILITCCDKDAVNGIYIPDGETPDFPYLKNRDPKNFPIKDQPRWRSVRNESKIDFFIQYTNNVLAHDDTVYVNRNADFTEGWILYSSKDGVIRPKSYHFVWFAKKNAIGNPKAPEKGFVSM